MTYYQEIHKDKLEYQLHQSYRDELADLAQVGFDDIHHTREVVFPFSALFFCYLYPILKLKGEILRIESPLRFVLFNPLVLNHEYATYAHVFGLGVKFMTLFTDDTMLTSTTYRTVKVVKPKRKLYGYGGKNATIDVAWKKHMTYLRGLEAEGCIPDPDLSIPKFEYLMHRDDKAMLFGR